MMLRATLGNAPWDVLHQGMAIHLPMSIGTAVIVMSLVVLVLWIPLREKPGLGTVTNSLVVGLVADLGLAVLDAPDALWQRSLLMVGGVVLNALATALYIGSQFGPGPRDGLMTGLHRRTGVSIRLVRTGLEVFVVAIGWLLGGVVGFGTVLYAVAIGPLVQLMLPRFIVRARGRGSRRERSAGQPAAVGQHDCLQPVADPELHQDPGNVGLDGALTDEEPSGDLCVRAALRHQREHLAFPLGQRVQPTGVDRGRRPPGQLAGDPPARPTRPAPRHRQRRPVLPPRAGRPERP